MSKEEIFVLIMLVLSAIAAVLSAGYKEFITALCDLLLCAMWGWDYYILKKREK